MFQRTINKQDVKTIMIGFERTHSESGELMSIHDVQLILGINHFQAKKHLDELVADGFCQFVCERVLSNSGLISHPHRGYKIKKDVSFIEQPRTKENQSFHAVQLQGLKTERDRKGPGEREEYK